MRESFFSSDRKTWENRGGMICNKGLQSDSNRGSCCYLASPVPIEIPGCSARLFISPPFLAKCLLLSNSTNSSFAVQAFCFCLCTLYATEGVTQLFSQAQCSGLLNEYLYFIILAFQVICYIHDSVLLSRLAPLVCCFVVLCAEFLSTDISVK